MAIYGKVENPQDIARINCIIRDEMLVAKDEATLTELKKRSDYLCTLTFSPFWKKRFRQSIEELRKVAIEENRVTVKEANIVAKYKGFDKEYQPWKKEIDIEAQLRSIPQEVIEEIESSAISLYQPSDILEFLRKQFCDLRKAMVLCEESECLEELKRGVDILSTLPYLRNFAAAFDEGVLSAIDALINLEKNRSVQLANMIAYVNGWDIYFEAISEEDFGSLSAEEVYKILEEEKKSLTHIPSEVRYKGGGKVLWIVYYHPKRKREYAKRIYLPAFYRNLKMEGPGEFKNRFGNRVWGVKITYEEQIAPTTIHVRGKEIQLPERWIERSKIVPLPEIAQNVRVVEEKPKSAMDIA